MRELLHRDEFLEIERWPERRVVVVARTERRLDDPQQMAAVYRRAFELDSGATPDWGIVLDLRRAPGRSDATFEDAVAPLRHRARERFARMVILVATAVGELQTRRLSRQDGGDAIVARDFDEAIELAAPTSIERARRR
ncbi:MAG: hypothetical protein AB7S26_27575 [Sandaracinaceae bacterium]